jgi:hypothetical protein
LKSCKQLDLVHVTWSSGLNDRGILENSSNSHGVS